MRYRNGVRIERSPSNLIQVAQELLGDTISLRISSSPQHSMRPSPQSGGNWCGERLLRRVMTADLYLIRKRWLKFKLFGALQLERRPRRFVTHFPIAAHSPKNNVRGSMYPIHSAIHRHATMAATSWKVGQKLMFEPDQRSRLLTTCFSRTCDPARRFAWGNSLRSRRGPDW